MRKRDVHAFLHDAAARLRAPAADWRAPLSFGVDLGTATIVVTAIDADRRPVYWNFLPCEAVRDGVVVNFARRSRRCARSAQEASQALGEDVVAAASAFPPGVAEAEARACRYVLENAGVTCRRLVDEVSAAQALLQIRDGAIVDVGGGSTGVGVVENGDSLSLSDTPGGGHHLDLILAGALRLPDRTRPNGASAPADARLPRSCAPASSASRIRSASRSRRERSRPFISSAARCASPTRRRSSAATSAFATVGYPHSELVTPFGIAMS